MIARAGSGWQTVLADLSLILFMVTAAALSQASDAPGPVPAPAPAAAPLAASATAEPLAVYRPGPGAPPLADWLALQAVDGRQQLSIVAHYGSGGMAVALAEAARLAGQAGAAGVEARVVVEPGEGGITATLAYDVPRATLAQGLLDKRQTRGSRKEQP